MIRPELPGPPRLRYRACLAVYAALMALAEPSIRRYFLRRAAADPAYGEHLEEREGRGERIDVDVWVHAVSMGEMRSAAPLVRLLLDEGRRVVTTHATPAGRRAAEAAFAPEIAAGRLAVRYAPLDRPAYWERFFDGARPRTGLVMEMEFWPWMIEAAARAGVPLCLVNSQVPGRSFPRARRLARLFGHPASRAAAVFAKSPRMADRFRDLGVTRVEALGETRFDIPLPQAQIEAGRLLCQERRVLTLASVVAGEESVFEDLAKALLADPQPPLILWVPRAPELFEATATRLADKGFRVARRSEVIGADLVPTRPLGDIQIIVGDSLGEMFFYLAPASAVVVGGGFVEKGAHNVIEPLSLGKPVLTGPHVWTIEFPGVEAKAAGVLTVVSDPANLAQAVRRAMDDGSAGAEAFHALHKGASRRIVDAIRPCLEDRA
ncbi:3-deoxy-D-manno-octulosonic acid transferase [Silicimonas algicola]|nr:glycosyltransferase N-terminal domain-containing protein [Silicimonas algicola]AZQ66530.1 3-deoxy-D-manno-octulosonic acid transferase [Silicimonas algicola]